VNNPEFPSAFTGILGMGIPKSYHPARKSSRIGNLVLCLLLLGAAVLVFLYGAYSAYQAYQKYGPVMITDKLSGPAILAFVLFAFGLLAGWGVYANWQKGVVLYDNGFAYRDRKGVRAWRWEQVDSLRAAITRHYTNGIYTGTTHVYTLFNQQGEKLVLADQITKVEELAQVIEESIFPRLYEQAARQYNNGETIAAGPVLVSKAGIQIGKKNYPWVEVDGVSIHQGFLKVSRKDGGWFSGASAAAATIPNLRVLLTILDQVVGVKTK
jgi:hypothetical protein